MKKSILALIFSGAILFTSCETEATVDSAEVQKIIPTHKLSLTLLLLLQPKP
jgi:PBP1b-binding outer membrane lipoprotein LpoB